MRNFPVAKSRRLRSTPYTDRIEAHGVSSYTVYNHMLLPASFKSLESDYHHLKKFVQVWDVAAERQVEISGKDSAKLVQLMTCRDLSKSKVGKCYYAPIIDDDGLLVQCGGGALLISTIQLAGKSKMCVAEVLKSKASIFSPGNRLGT